MFFEFPADPACWTIEDQYLLGADLLVAPLFEEAEERDVYLPEGKWIDYQTGEIYEGLRWINISAGPVPIVLLVRSGAAIPQVEPAASLDQVDWDQVKFVHYSADGAACNGIWYHPMKKVIVECS